MVRPIGGNEQPINSVQSKGLANKAPYQKTADKVPHPKPQQTSAKKYNYSLQNREENLTLLFKGGMRAQVGSIKNIAQEALQSPKTKAKDFKATAPVPDKIAGLRRKL